MLQYLLQQRNFVCVALGLRGHGTCGRLPVQCGVHIAAARKHDTVQPADQGRCGGMVGADRHNDRQAARALDGVDVICRKQVPEIVDIDGHKVRCFLYENAEGSALSGAAIAAAEAEVLADVEAAREVETAEALLAAEDLREAEIEGLEKDEEANR